MVTLPPVVVWVRSLRSAAFEGVNTEAVNKVPKTHKTHFIILTLTPQSIATQATHALHKEFVRDKRGETGTKPIIISQSGSIRLELNANVSTVAAP